jgi:hypothetical protein
VWSRWQKNQEIERRAAEKRREDDRRAVEMMGEIRRGETLTLCCGVANAKKVTLEPQSNPVWPSYARCVDLKPAAAEDAAGHQKTPTLTVRVR